MCASLSRKSMVISISSIILLEGYVYIFYCDVYVVVHIFL